MSDPTPPLRASVLETPERMVFRVLSDDGKKRYRVDLLAMGGAAQCECGDWLNRRCKAIARGEPFFTRATACKHVIRAALYVCRKTFPRMAKELEGPR